MTRTLFFWLFAPLVGLLAACTTEEVQIGPLNTSLMSISDKFYDVAALSPEKAVVVGYGGKILLTTDGGRKWQQQPSGTELALYNIKFTDAQTGWISGQGGLVLHTTNGGETWRPQQSGTDEPIFALSFADKNHGWGVASVATYIHTTNGGETWEVGRVEASVEGVDEESTLALVDPTLYDVHFIDTQTGWMVGEFGKIYHTSDGGAHWTEQQNTLLGQSGFNDALEFPAFFGVHFRNSQEGIAVGVEGKIVKTTDGGQHWNFIAEDFSRFDSSAFFAPLLYGENKGWIVGAAGRMLQLENGAWKRTSLGTQVVIWLRAIEFFDDKHGWVVGGYGTILSTEDGGKRWVQRLG
jgi:photosystem II stability/assembly factor-like uncharacterized protein